MNSLRLTFRRLVPMLLIVLVSQTASATIFEEFLFDDPNGTAIENAVNNANPGSFFDVDADNAGVVTNGLGQLNASLKNNDDFGTNYVDVTAITTGTVYGVIELTWDFQSVLNPSENEAIRLTLVNADPRSTQVTAEVQINRSDSDVIVIDGAADGTGSSDLLQTTLNGGSLTQSDTFVGVVAADLDNDTYEILYSTDDYATFQSAGTGSISPSRGVESLRMVLNNNLFNDNVLIDRVYLTDVSPVPSVDKLILEVNSTTGLMTMKNTSLSSSFDIDYYKIDSASSDLDPNGWNSLSDQEYDAIDGADPNSIAGDGIGETWDEAGGSDDSVLSERFLLGSSVFTPSESIGLGNAFQVGGDISMLTFEYRDTVTGNIIEGIIEEVTGLSADFDGDNDVDGVDFLIFQRGFGLVGQTDNSNGDADGNGVVDSADLAEWEAQYGMTFPLSANATAVPEPTSLMLIGAATLLTILRGGRRRN